jgi:hypothetical protein
MNEDGSPFFYLGDTAWELFHKLNREEAEMYLENRRQKGFTVIQAVILAELGGLTVPNKYGHTPLFNNNPTTPNESYFEHVDWIINKAEEKGLYIGLLPTWGDKVTKLWGNGPEIFNTTNARIYGQYLGNRYKNRTNIIWMIGGDRNPENSGKVDIWRAMAEGVQTGTGANPTMTFHPQGESRSSTWFHSDSWLDFNTIQSGHARRDIQIWDWITDDWNKTPVKPTMDSEPSYEDHPINWNPGNGYFRDHDVRKQLYRSVFAGGHGVTYGHHSIW